MLFDFYYDGGLAVTGLLRCVSSSSDLSLPGVIRDNYTLDVDFVPLIDTVKNNLHLGATCDEECIQI